MQFPPLDSLELRSLQRAIALVEPTRDLCVVHLPLTGPHHAWPAQLSLSELARLLRLQLMSNQLGVYRQLAVDPPQAFARLRQSHGALRLLPARLRCPCGSLLWQPTALHAQQPLLTAQDRDTWGYWGLSKNCSRD